jgi:hypothetical protein
VELARRVRSGCREELGLGRQHRAERAAAHWVKLARRVQSGYRAEVGLGRQHRAARVAARAVPIAGVPLRAAHLGAVVTPGGRSAWPVGTVEAPETPPAPLVARASRFAARRSEAH